MTPDEILGAMAEVYATCPTYRDSGQVVTHFFDPGSDRPKRTSVRPFETAFVRPDRFRFEYRNRYKDDGPWYRHIVWAKGGDVRMWWDVRTGVEYPDSLGMAIAAATGVSGGSAHVVPA